MNVIPMLPFIGSLYTARFHPGFSRFAGRAKLHLST